MSAMFGRRAVRAALPFIVASVLAVVGAGQRPASPRRGYVLGPDEGEALQLGNGRILIKADPRTSSTQLAMGVQTLAPGGEIRLHLHESEDEILFVHEGARTVMVGDQTRVGTKGSTVYIPHGVWHGVAASNDEAQIVWVVSPPGLEDYFRDVGTAPGASPKQLTPERIDSIRRKHGYRVPGR